MRDPVKALAVARHDDAADPVAQQHLDVGLLLLRLLVGNAQEQLAVVRRDSVFHFLDQLREEILFG